MKKVLIALNSFKECASSVELSELTKNLLLEKLDSKENEFVVKPISDGGDGFLETVARQFNLELFNIEISTPYDEDKMICPVGYSKNDKTIYIESAKILGLNIIPHDKRKPLELSSKGFGEIFKALKNLMDKGERQIEKVVVGVGGTGTSDFGIGALSQLGLKIFDEDGKTPAPQPKNFLLAESIKFGSLERLPFELEFVIDVENELLGKTGANHLFAAQKGANEKEIETLERGFEKIISLTPDNLLRGKKLSGAGGGLPAAFKIFYNAKYKSAKDFILNDLSLSSENSNFNLVISGEGKLDNQTELQKGVQIIIDEYKRKVPVVIIAGIVGNYSADENVNVIELKKYFTSIDESIKNYKTGFKKAIDEIVEKYFIKEK
ncbi:MAG: glycerate kinase [Chlorobi bacterium]|nr:glycerate kinase [Chlorobiota bacterium]